MARRKTAEVEVIPPEDDQPKRGRKKLVDAKHTITYEAPVPVTVEESDDEGLIVEDDFEEAEEKPRRRPARNERDELRKKLAANHVTPGSELKLSIERYLHSETSDGGTWSETEFCTKYTCSEAHITNEDYLDVARKWGVGKYRFTLRMNNKIVTAWDKRISAATIQSPHQQVIQHAIPGDPTSPQVIVQMPEGMTQQVTPVDSMKQLKELLQMQKLMREALGTETTAQQSQPIAAIEPKVAALQLIAENPAVMEKIGDGLASIVGGRRGNSDDPSWGAVAMELVKSGQAAEVVRVAIDAIFNGVGGLFPAGGNNGTPQMASPSLAQRPRLENQRPQFRQNPHQKAQQESPQSSTHTGETAAESSVSPEDQVINQLLGFVIEQCKLQTSPEIVADSIDAYLGQVQDQAPFVYPAVIKQVELFVESSTDAALEFVKGMEGGETVASLPHAKEWTAKLQELLKEDEADEAK